MPIRDLELSTEVCHAIESAVADRTLELRQAVQPLVELALLSVKKSGREWPDDAPWLATDGIVVTWGHARRLLAVWAGTEPLPPFDAARHAEQEASDRARFSGPQLRMG